MSDQNEIQNILDALPPDKAMEVVYLWNESKFTVNKFIALETLKPIKRPEVKP